MRNGIDGGEVHEAHTLTARLGTYDGMHVHDKCMTKMLTRLGRCGGGGGERGRVKRWARLVWCGHDDEAR